MAQYRRSTKSWMGSLRLPQTRASYSSVPSSSWHGTSTYKGNSIYLVNWFHSPVLRSKTNKHFPQKDDVRSSTFTCQWLRHLLPTILRIRSSATVITIHSSMIPNQSCVLLLLFPRKKSTYSYCFPHVYFLFLRILWLVKWK